MACRDPQLLLALRGALELGTLEGEDRERLACAACGFIAYVNPRLVVTCLPVTDAGEVMLLRRGIQPGRGLWAQPGGFMEVDETVEAGAARECLEETGLMVEPGEIVGLYTRPEAAIVVIAFAARVIGGAAIATPEALEVRPFRPEAIPWPELAFRTTEWALRDWVRRVRPDLEAGGRQVPRTGVTAAEPTAGPAGVSRSSPPSKGSPG